MTPTPRIAPSIRCWHCKAPRPATDKDCYYCSRPARPAMRQPGICACCGRPANSATDYGCLACSRKDPEPKLTERMVLELEGLVKV